MKIIASAGYNRHNDGNSQWLIQASSGELEMITGKSDRCLNPSIGMEIKVSVIFAHIKSVREMTRQLSAAQVALTCALAAIENAEPFVKMIEEVNEKGNHNEH